MKYTIPEVIDRFIAYNARIESQPINLRSKSLKGIIPEWGSLHIVMADGNVKDSDVQWCKDRAHERGDTEGEALADILLNMSKTQRRKLYRQI